MQWFIIFILLLVFVPFVRYSLGFLVVFVVINILLILAEAYFRKGNKNSTMFQFRRRPPKQPGATQKPASYEDVQDAEFREKK